MTVAELIAALQQVPESDRRLRLVAEYDSGLYPVTGLKEARVEKYPLYDLIEGERVLQVVYAEYQ